MSQKFHKGDLVHVAADLGHSMSHFTADIDAIVLGSYNDQYGGGDTKSYSLHLKGHGPCSWYYENQLELLNANRKDLLKQWEAQEKAEIKQLSDLDWIFENGPTLVNGMQGASVQALATAVGLPNLWGSRGEGIDYYENSLSVWAFAKSYLERKDKSGWLKLKDKPSLVLNTRYGRV